MKQFILLIAALMLLSCNSKKGNMQVHGKITNFQKGKVYLEKMKDTILVKVDSVSLDAANTFTLSDDVVSPQLYFLTISNSDKYIPFFGEKGAISIISDYKTFGYKPLIQGSKNQTVLEKYEKMNSKFTNASLDLIKDKFDAIKLKDTALVRAIEQKISNLERRRYLYTLNFAVNHADMEVAPFIVLTKIPNANPKLLDTVQKALSVKVKASFYGKQFIAFLKK